MYPSAVCIHTDGTQALGAMLVAASHSNTLPTLGDALLVAAHAMPGGAMQVLGAVVCDGNACATARAAALSLVGTALQRGKVLADSMLLAVLLFAASSPHAVLRAASVELATVRVG